MTTMNDLSNAIDQFLNHPLGINNYQLVRDVAEKAYEAYVFCLCLEAVRRLNGNIDLRSISQPQAIPNPFVFRGAPGSIYSSHKNYGYASCKLGDKEFEIHNSVEFIGTSTATHEIDVSIIEKSQSEKCRNDKRDPKNTALLAAWECKFYDHNLNIALARTLVGLLDDMGNKYFITGFSSNNDSASIRRYLSKKNRPQPCLLLSPLNNQNEELFINDLMASLRKWSQIS